MAAVPRIDPVDRVVQRPEPRVVPIFGDIDYLARLCPSKGCGIQWQVAYEIGGPEPWSCFFIPDLHKPVGVSYSRDFLLRQLPFVESHVVGGALSDGTSLN